VSRAPYAVAPPLVLRQDRETLARLTSRWSKPPDLDTCPALSFIRQFYGATDKLKSVWFWGTYKETVAVILRPKLKNRSCRVWGPNWETRATGFEAKQEKTAATSFEAKTEKTVQVVLRLNHSQTVNFVFEAQPRNTRSSSQYARCRPHTVSPDLSIARPPSTWPVWPSAVLYTRSSTPTTILVAARHVATAHHETSKHDSLKETEINVKWSKYLGFEFKHRQVNDSSQ
jgi:hypothetical protein